MTDSLLVTIEKGAQRLQVHVKALEEHLRLGWKKVEDEAEELVVTIEGDGQKLADAVKGVGRKGKAAARTQQA